MVAVNNRMDKRHFDSMSILVLGAVWKTGPTIEHCHFLSDRVYVMSIRICNVGIAGCDVLGNWNAFTQIGGVIPMRLNFSVTMSANPMIPVGEGTTHTASGLQPVTAVVT